MKYSKRPYRGASDQSEALDIAVADRASHLHVVDLPYRLCSWGLDDPRNVGVWIDDVGNMVGFAVIQLPFQALDLITTQEAQTTLLAAEIIGWALERLNELAREDRKDVTVYVSVPEHDRCLINQLESHGFFRIAGFLVHQKLPLPLAAPSRPPAGYAIRNLHGLGEVEAYVELHRTAFGTNNMTVDWRRRTLGHPLYVPEIDLVAVAPDGSLAAFCVCWIDGDRCQGQIEPLGVHPDHQKAGLGGALLLEGLSRLGELGATSALVNFFSGDEAARATYEGAGFRRNYTAPTLAISVSL